MKTSSSLCVLSLVALFALVSCNQQDHYLINIKQRATEKVEELERGIANIVWVVDTSGSMSSHLNNVARNANAFTDILDDMNIEFTLGSVIAHGSRWNPSEAGQFEGQPPVITPQTPNWKDTFSSNFPTNLEGGEEMLDAAFWLFDPQRLTKSPWLDFYTPGAHLFLIIVSDTDDIHGRTSPKDLADRLIQLYGESYVHYYGFLCMTDSDCDSEWTRGNPQQNRVVQLGDYVNAKFFEKSDSDYSPHLKTIAEHIVQIVSRYELKSVPVVKTITVEINGEEIESSRKNGWTYDMDANAIVFHGTATPRNDDDIQIRYKPELINQ